MSTIKSVNVQHPSAASPNISLDSSGNVGVGVTPSYQFEVKTANDAILRTINSGATQISQIQSTNLARSAYAPLSIGGSYTVLETGGSERMRIDSSGNVGIGTSSPSAKLAVNGTLAFDSGYGSVATAYGCRAWVNFNGSLAAESMIRASGNVQSITDNGTGDYTVNFTTGSEMPDTNYAVTVGTCAVASDPVPLAGASRTNNPIITNLTTGSFSVGTVNAGGTAFVDAENIFLAVFR